MTKPQSSPAGSVPEPGAHGGDAVAVAHALGLDPASVLDLSASLNPFAPDVAALAASHLDSLGRYPDERAAAETLAAAIGVDPARLVLTNGGAEAIALVAAEVGRGAIVEPEFSLYRRHLPDVRPDAPRWRSNPSNPLGVLADERDEAGVWDEAFYPLATGHWTRGDENCWRLGSLTKLWACPGLRLGYAIGPDPAAAARIRRRKTQWSVNGLALALIEPLLRETDLGAWSQSIAVARQELAGQLTELGLAVRPSTANWLLIDGVSGLRSALARRAVVVRDCAGFGLDGTVRLALPAPRHVDRVVSAIAACIRG